MKLLSRVFSLFLLTLPIAAPCFDISSAEDSNTSDLESGSGQEVLPRNWDIVGMKFSKRLIPNNKKGTYILKITPTFQYTTSTSTPISFEDSSIWEVNCGMVIAGTETTEPQILFDQRKEFPVPKITLENGQKTRSSVSIEFDKKLAKYLRGEDAVSLACGFGFAKPEEYHDVGMQTRNGIFMTYVFRLQKMRWEVRGMNF